MTMQGSKLSNQNYAELFDAAPDAIVVVDAQGIIELANRRTEELFGWPREELIGRPIEVLVPSRVGHAHVGERTRYLASPSTREMGSGRELQALRRDGTEFPVEISLSPLRTEAGLLVSSIIRDVSERRRLESDARRTADHLRSAVESIQDSFALFDADERLVLCNSTYRDAFARSFSDGVVGRTYEEILDASLAEQTMDRGEESLEDFRVRMMAFHDANDGPLELTTRTGHKLRVVERATPEGGTVVLVWDLTEDARREDELKRMRTLAEAASMAKSEFLSSMSHELRTPLNAVLGFAQLLRRDRKQSLDDRQRTMVEHVIKGGEHLLRLIDDVLDLSRIEAGRVMISTEPVGVAEVLAEVKDGLEPMAGRAGITLEVEPVAAACAQITADRTRMTQILMNYGSNAIKYGRSGGTVKFRASAPSSGRVRLAVIDDGIGIAQDQHERIFQPFQRAGQETGPIEGTGIGLAITKRLAQMMHGEVGFDSELGQGSEFWVELPRSEGQRVAPALGVERVDDEVATLAGGHAPQIKVVYIEDNPANVAFMQELLGEFERVELHSAPSAELGLELVRRVLPNVVIMDINLPGMDGFAATRRLREWPETRDIPVIGLSAAAMPRDRKLAEDAGLYRYLTKPVDVDALVATLESVLAPGGSSSSAPSSSSR